MIRRLFEKLKLIKPRQPHLPQTNVSSRFVLLKGVNGNVFWTTDDGSDHEKDGFTILHRGTDCNEMIAKWEDYYRGRL